MRVSHRNIGRSIGRIGINSRRGGGIPNKSDALFWLDGTILDVEGTKYFVDKISGKNFLITDYDFSTDWTKGFPYKSAATISAPADDATLIAADINNYLYDSGGDPNQIPVVSLFQDIDYEHKLFTRHIAQVVGPITGVEIVEPQVRDIVLYSTVRSGADLTKCQSYYGVPTNTETLTLKPSGGDYSTFESSIAAADDNIIGVYTKIYDEDPVSDRFLINHTLQYIVRGLVTLTDTGEDAFYLRPYNKVVTLNGFIIDNKGTAGIIVLVDGTNLTNEKLKIISDDNDKIYRISENPFGVLTLKNNIFVGSADNIIESALKAGTILFDSNVVNSYHSRMFNVTGSGVLNIKNNKINLNNILSSNIFTGAAQSLEFSFYGNRVNISNCVDELTCLYLSGILTSINIHNNKISISEITKTSIWCYRLVNNANLDIYNNIINSQLTGSLIGISISSTGDSSINGIIRNNYIDGKNSTSGSFAALIGTDAFSANNNLCDGGEIRFNHFIGDYAYNTEALDSIRGAFIGWNLGNVRHNYIEGADRGVVTKNDDDDNAHVFGNVLLNNAVGVYNKGANNIVISGNTIITKTIPSQGIYIAANNDADRSGSIPKTNIIKNNIIIDIQTSYLLDIDESEGNEHSIDYNIYYSESATPFKYNGTDKTWTEWKALGYDANSIMLTSLAEAKALFTDYDNNDYSLVSGSSAIGAGETLAAAYDDGLDSSTNWGDDSTVPTVVTKQQTAPWDIGAYVS